MNILKTLGLYGIGKKLFRRKKKSRAGALALWGGSGILPAIGYLGWRNRHKLMSMWDRYMGRSSMKGSLGQGSRIGQPIGRTSSASI